MTAEPAKTNKGGRPKGSRSQFTLDFRQAVEQAFHKLGGAQWLVRLGKRRPDVLAQLLGKMIPAEVKMSVLAAYQALPSVPVEIREAIPGSTSPALPAPSPSVLALPAQDDDFFALAAPAVNDSVHQDEAL